MSDWAMAHPWLTFFLVLAVLQAGGNVLVALFAPRHRCQYEPKCEPKDATEA